MSNIQYPTLKNIEHLTLNAEHREGGERSDDRGDWGSGDEGEDDSEGF